MSAGPRVLLLNHTAVLGGAEVALLRLVDALPDDVRTSSVSAVVLDDGPLVQALQDRGVPVSMTPLAEDISGLTRHEILRPANAAKAVWGALSTVRAIRRTIAEQGPDLVQSGSMKAHLLGMVSTIGTRTPLVWYLHDLVSPPYLSPALARLIRLCSRYPTAIFSNSHATAQTLPRRSTVVYPGYLPTMVRPTRGNQPSGSAPFLLLGRLSPTKGQLEFVRAASQVHAVHPTQQFLIVGSPMFGAEDYAQQVSRLIDDLGLTEVVRLAGFASDPTPLLDEARALVHASPVPEPFGQVILEAVLRHLPVIATRAGGAPEILTGPDGTEHGLLVSPGDVNALADAMLDVLADPESAQSRAAAAYLHAVETFPLSSSVDRMTAVWSRVAGRRRRYGRLRSWSSTSAT